MAIKGLTDRNLSFPQIGNIRKGDKGGKNGAPRELEWFRVEFDEKETTRAAKFLEIYGQHPTEINILLPFNEIERTWDAWCEAYTAGRMVARSDGEYFSYLVDHQTGKTLVINGANSEGQKVPHREVVGRTEKSVIKCRPVGRLKVLIPELQSLAYLVVHTTSVIDIRNISEQLEAIRQINNGRIAGIPLVLRRRPKKISVPKPGGEKVRMTKHMISIEADPQWVAAMLDHLNTAALPGYQPRALLPEQTETREEYEEVGQDDIVDNADIQDPWTDEIAEEQDAPEATETEPTEDPCGAVVEPGPEKMTLSFAKSLLTLDGKRKMDELLTDELKKSKAKYQTMLNERKDLTEDQRTSLTVRIEAADLITDCRQHAQA